MSRRRLPISSVLPVLASLLVVMLAFESSAAAVAERLVHRRGGLGSFPIERAAATRDGLRVVRTDRGLDREELVPWDRLAAVDPRPSDGSLEVGVESGLAFGDRLWRGRIRLRRGDARLAREAFLEAMAMSSDRVGSMFALALEGLVSSAILEGRIQDVQAQAMVLGELGLAGARTDRFLGAAYSGDVVDARTNLVPMVPPVSAGTAGLDIREYLRNQPEIHESSRLRRDLWIKLLDGSGPPEVSSKGLDAGTSYLLELASADSEDQRTREQARRRLLERLLKDAPNWEIAWTRHRIGRASLRHAQNDEERLRGVLDLIQVMALEDAAPPALRLDAGRHLVDGLRAIGRDEEARTIQTMLLIEFPDQQPMENTP